MTTTSVLAIAISVVTKALGASLVAGICLPPRRRLAAVAAVHLTAVVALANVEDLNAPRATNLYEYKLLHHASALRTRAIFLTESDASGTFSRRRRPLST